MKRKTLDQLRQEKRAVEKALHQTQHHIQRLENRAKYLEDGARRKRTHRLCIKGGVIESLCPGLKDMEQTQFYQLMEHIFTLPQVRALAAEAIRQQHDGTVEP